MTSITVPSFSISELSGRMRRVLLRGRGLPYRPLKLEGEQRVKITNPAGNPDGYGTITGPTEGETTVSGYWKDKYLFYDEGQLPPIEMTSVTSGSGLSAAGEEIGGRAVATPVSSSIDAIELLDSIRREGQLCKVEWGPIIRHGYLKKVSQTWHNVHDVEWEAVFAWVGRSRANDFEAQFSPPGGTLDTGNALRNALRSLARILDTPGPMVRGFMDDINNTMNTLGGFTNQIEQTASGLIDSTNLFTPRGIGGSLGALLGSVVVSADNLKDQFMDNGWAGAFTRPQDFLPYGRELAGASPFLSTPAAPEYLGPDADTLLDAERQAQEMMYTLEAEQELRNMRNEALARREPYIQGDTETMGIYTAREIDNLREVANLYYGGTTHWREIMVYNNLLSSELHAGQRITIPRLAVAREDL